ncbi:MAG: hypothetical protein ACYDCO_20750 [Armatimonadota bacterium]
MILQQDEFGDRTNHLYRHVLQLPRCGFETPRRALPTNGIYLFFEDGETVDIDGQCCDRIVRVGTHVKDGRFPTRIRQHYGARSSLNGNKNASVFRRHLGGALMRQANPADPRLPDWQRQHGGRDLAFEAQVSQYLRRYFTFVCFAVPESTERLSLEAGLIALLAQAPLGMPSRNWLGQYAAAPEIVRTGLWNTRHVDDIPLTTAQLDHLTA